MPGGRLLLFGHIGGSASPSRGLQWLVERVSIRLAGEHFTRRQLPLVRHAGVYIAEVARLKAGTVERVHAVKPG